MPLPSLSSEEIAELRGRFGRDEPIHRERRLRQIAEHERDRFAVALADAHMGCEVCPYCAEPSHSPHEADCVLGAAHNRVTEKWGEIRG